MKTEQREEGTMKHERTENIRSLVYSVLAVSLLVITLIYMLRV